MHLNPQWFGDKCQYLRAFDKARDIKVLCLHFSCIVQHFSKPFTLEFLQLLQLWEKNGYFDESIIQQLQSPALGLGQYQVSHKSNPFLIYGAILKTSLGNVFLSFLKGKY